MDERERKRARAVAKTLVGEWFDRLGDDITLRAPLLRGLDTFLDEVQRRDSWSECMTVMLGDRKAPSIAGSAYRSRITPCKDGLAVSSVVPGWGFGWSPHLTDPYVYDTLSWFGHYARQYIHRSEVAKVLMIAWELDGAILHPFGSRVNFRRYGAVTASVTRKVALDEAAINVAKEWGRPRQTPQQTRSKWLRRNVLDPGLHQCIFHFLRAETLVAAGFAIEAIVAFDCAIEALRSLNWQLSPNPRNGRPALYTALSLGPRDVQIADHIYFLRNEFGAHAGGWRWWDVGEYIDEGLMATSSRLVLRMLKRAADMEPDHRTLDPNPARWADWLFENFTSVWRATWFK